MVATAASDSSVFLWLALRRFLPHDDLKVENVVPFVIDQLLSKFLIEPLQELNKAITRS